MFENFKGRSAHRWTLAQLHNSGKPIRAATVRERTSYSKHTEMKVRLLTRAARIPKSIAVESQPFDAERPSGGGVGLDQHGRQPDVLFRRLEAGGHLRQEPLQNGFLRDADNGVIG